MIPEQTHSSSTIHSFLSMCAAVALTSCTHGKATSSQTIEPERIEPPGYITSLPEQALAISPPSSPPPPWLEETSTTLTTPRLGPGPLITFGERVSLHRTSHGMLAVHADTGVIGPIVLPEQSTWVGVDGKDHIWVGRFADGKLFRANRASEAHTPTAFAEVRTIPGARAWDASGPHIAIATEQSIWVSNDHGESWKERRVPELERILQVYVRGDGVMVAQGENEESRALKEDLPSTWISTTRGISWSFSPYQPGKLERDGSWIWSGDTTCVATLTDDGKAWSANPDLSNLPGYKDPREHMLSLTYSLHAPAAQSSIATTQSPGPPAHTQPLHQGLVASCQDPIMSHIDPASPTTPTELERGPRQEICQQISCLRGYTPETTSSRHEAYLLADAACTWPQEVVPVNDPGCAAQGAKVTRPPHVVLWDRDADTLEMSNPPEQCTPEKIFNSRGLHILACRKNGDITDLWTRTATTQWKQEAVVDVAANKLERVSSSEDGTLVVHGVCTASSCAPSYLRQPRASGEQNIWSAVDVPQSLTVIPLLAGNAIVASQRGDQTTSLQLWFVEGGERLSHLLEVPEITEPVNALTAHDNSTTLKLHLGDPMTSRAFVIQGDGTLVKP